MRTEYSIILLFRHILYKDGVFRILYRADLDERFLLPWALIFLHRCAIIHSFSPVLLQAGPLDPASCCPYYTIVLRMYMTNVWASLLPTPPTGPKTRTADPEEQIGKGNFYAWNKNASSPVRRLWPDQSLPAAEYSGNRRTPSPSVELLRSSCLSGYILQSHLTCIVPSASRAFTYVTSSSPEILEIHRLFTSARCSTISKLIYYYQPTPGWFPLIRCEPFPPPSPIFFFFNRHYSV